MKRLIFAFALAATVCACNKESYNDEFTGSFSYNTTAGSHYLQTIATELLVDNMRALENALEFNSFGSVSNSRTSSYHSNGKDLWTPGAEWTVNAVTSIKGVKISKDAADSTWTLTRDADYGMAGNTYPTAYSITLRMHKAARKARVPKARAIAASSGQTARSITRPQRAGTTGRRHSAPCGWKSIAATRLSTVPSSATTAVPRITGICAGSRPAGVVCILSGI